LAAIRRVTSFPTRITAGNFSGPRTTAIAAWLPQYAAEIPRARQRLADHERNGTRVKLRQTKGAARLDVKSVEELARDKAEARANAAAADKGKLTTAAAAKL